MRKTKSSLNPNQLKIDFDVIMQDIFLDGDIHNIRNMLPKLYEHQQEDVAKAEKRFLNGKGYLFTNGTGTGKTFVGLGIAFRFFKKNKKNILIVAPTDQKCMDWIKEGEIINLKISKLLDTNDCGKDVVVTTYANFYANLKLNYRHWDLIIYDESHYLNQNSKGNVTVYQEQHKNLSNVPSAAKQKVLNRLGKRPEYNYDLLKDLNIEQKKEYAETVNSKREIYDQEFQQQLNEIVNSTKVVFLSATPFAYHKSILYADGCLWDIFESLNENEDRSYAYNEMNSYEQFMQQSFGYRMKYNKLTIPESGVDLDLMERNFFEENVEKGIMSTRVLELDYDYSREFIILDSELGKKINDGIEIIYSQEFSEKFPVLYQYAPRKYNYLYINQLLELLKAQLIHKRIKQHLALNRKIVVFHGYNNSYLEHPFRFDITKMIPDSEERYLNGDDLSKDIQRFYVEYSEYAGLNIDKLINTREALKKHFPWLCEFNGTIPKKKRSQNIQRFNDDFSGMNLLVVQEKAGREGISLHDKTGMYQRVLINLGLPVAPTAAIQTEGRIYREGLKSNGIYEYAILNLSSEMYAFATKIAERARTAENLAMGNKARDLESAFKDGYVDAIDEKPHLGQGIGGKDKDRNTYSMTEFDKAISYYYSNIKRNSKNRAKEGIDYYATPEPLGYKIVEWLDIQENEECLEPSAGHGAIARFFPGHSNNKMIEPSFSLMSKLSVYAKGTILNERFEDLSYMNKFHKIAMNPPFGKNAKTAIEHLQKAITKHLQTNGVLYAIVPNSKKMDEGLSNILNNDRGRFFRHSGTLILPACTFNRAGTSVNCKIYKIEHLSVYSGGFTDIDMTYCKDINMFFDELRNLKF